MATVTVYDFVTEEQIVPVTLTASDDASLSLSKKSHIIIDNITAGALTVNILGDTATSIECNGVGTIDLSGGKDFSIPTGEVHKIPLNPYYQEWIQSGAITITGGTGATAYIIEI